jgi:hypothetical protein
MMHSSTSKREDALPLSRPKQDETTGIPFYFGQSYSASSDPNGAIALWEARTLHACVCESSWPVGLKRNETQESEYFGPDCSLKRCPTGDDPETIVDETDCTNKTAAGGRGVGKSGNMYVAVSMPPEANVGNAKTLTCVQTLAGVILIARGVGCVTI